MYDMYDITDLFGTEYWNYECPDGGTPKLELNNIIKEYDTYNIEILHYKDSQRSNLLIPFPHQIKFYEDWTNHEVIITFVNKNDDVSARYTIGLGHLDKEDLKVNLWGDGELLESRILTEPEQIIYERSEDRR